MRIAVTGPIVTESPTADIGFWLTRLGLEPVLVDAVGLDPADHQDLVVVTPEDPDVMIRHTDHCRRTGTVFAAAPSQQLTLLDRDQVRGLVEDSWFLFSNQTEAALLLERGEWTDREVLSRVGTWITTTGSDGVVIRREGETPVTVRAVPAQADAAPAGAGNAFRAGFLAGTAWGLPVRRAVQLGCTLAAAVLESSVRQGHELSERRMVAQICEVYGLTAAAEIAPRLVALEGCRVPDGRRLALRH